MQELYILELLIDPNLVDVEFNYNHHSVPEKETCDLRIFCKDPDTDESYGFWGKNLSIKNKQFISILQNFELNKTK